MKNLTLKKFLSYIQTKQDLTVYFRKYLMKIFTTEQTAFAVFFNTTTATNISPIDIQLLENNCEEADPSFVRCKKAESLLPTEDCFSGQMYFCCLYIIFETYLYLQVLLLVGRVIRVQLILGWHTKLWEQKKLSIVVFSCVHKL